MRSRFYTKGTAANRPSQKLAMLLVLTSLAAIMYQNPFGLKDTYAQTTGTTYYLSINGNDANSGTSISTAWKSIAKVNSINFSGGDQILFEGGSTFVGEIDFDSLDTGSAATPITISSYGPGRAVIKGSGTAFYAYNTAGIRITNINFAGGGRTINTASGVVFYTDLPGGVKLDYVHISAVDVSGFGRNGIVIGGWNGDTAYHDIAITDVTAHDNGDTGIATYAQNMFANQGVYIGHVSTYNNAGIASATDPTGNGIVLGAVDGAVIERSVAYNNGFNNTSASGPVGIWAYDATNVLIQYNESYNNRTGGTTDGGGFDLDQNVSHSVLQYNYSHGNDGAGFMICHAPNNPLSTGNTIRYNISQNDGRKNSYAAIQIYGGVASADIYNNSVYLAKASTGTPRVVSIQNTGIETQDPHSIHVRNNIFYTSSNTLPEVDVSKTVLDGGTDILFQGNDYYANGSTPAFKWKGSTYAGLSAWRSASGQEKLAGQSVGFSTNPKYTSAGNGGTIGNPDNLSSLSAYQLQSTSPLIDKGMNLASVFGTSPGNADFYGAAIPQGGGYDVGAAEYSTSLAQTSPPTSTPVPTNAPTPTPTSPAAPTPTAPPAPTAMATGSQVVVFIPIADCYVRSDTPSTNYGTNSSLTVVGGSLVRISYLKFDLTPLAGRHITSAVFRMYVNNSSAGSFSIKATSTDSWSETGVTYSNRPALGSAFGGFTPGSVSSGWVETDVSSGAFGREGQLFSFAIDGTSGDTYGFDSRNSSTASQVPQLVVSYQ